MKDHHFVLLVPEMLEAQQRFFHIIEEVGDNNYQPSFFYSFGKIMEYFLYIGSRAGRRLLEFLKYQPKMPGTVARRNIGIYFTVKPYETNRIPLLQKQKSKR